MTNRHFSYIWKEKKPSKLKMVCQMIIAWLIGYVIIWILVAVAALQQ